MLGSTNAKIVTAPQVFFYFLSVLEPPAYNLSLFTLLRTLLRFFARFINSTLLFSDDSALFAKNHPGWGEVESIQREPPSALALSPLAATLMDLPASVANKGLAAWLSPLAATLTKNRGPFTLPREVQSRGSFRFSRRPRRMCWSPIGLRRRIKARLRHATRFSARSWAKWMPRGLRE
jgi:hypothetical protein